MTPKNEKKNYIFNKLYTLNCFREKAEEQTGGYGNRWYVAML